MQKHLIILSHGQGSLGQACFAFQIAVSLQIVGIEVVMYLSSSAAQWVHKETDRSMKLCGQKDIQYYIDNFIKNGGQMFVCGTCIMEQCGLKEEDVKSHLIEGVECLGMSQLVELSLEAKVLTF